MKKILIAIAAATMALTNTAFAVGVSADVMEKTAPSTVATVPVEAATVANPALPSIAPLSANSTIVACDDVETERKRELFDSFPSGHSAPSDVPLVTACGDEGGYSDTVIDSYPSSAHATPLSTPEVLACGEEDGYSDTVIDSYPSGAHSEALPSSGVVASAALMPGGVAA